jgi:hypothetical protein
LVIAMPLGELLFLIEAPCQRLALAWRGLCPRPDLSTDSFAEFTERLKEIRLIR